MKINEKTYKWNGVLAKRPSTDYIILHHRAGSGDVDSIHAGHLTQGWVGIGYHFYIRKDGSVYNGRPIDTIGAHCTGKNGYSVGVCFEGNFEHETITEAQLAAGKELITYLKGLYPKAEIKRHKDFQSTACPGKNFPFEDIKKGGHILTIDEAIKIVKTKAGLEDDTIKFLLCYKYGEELLKKLAKGMQ